MARPIKPGKEITMKEIEKLFDELHELESQYFLTNLNQNSFNAMREKFIDTLSNRLEKLVVKGVSQPVMNQEINLLKNNDNRTDTDLEWIEEFYNFLQGEIPDNIRLVRGHRPKLTKKKAFAIISYLQEHFPILPDNIEKCDNCGTLYDDDSEGIYWETKAKHYCSGCDHLVPYNYDRGKR